MNIKGPGARSPKRRTNSKEHLFSQSLNNKLVHVTWGLSNKKTVIQIKHEKRRNICYLEWKDFENNTEKERNKFEKMIYLLF